MCCCLLLSLPHHTHLVYMFYLVTPCLFPLLLEAFYFIFPLLLLVLHDNLIQFLIRILLTLNFVFTLHRLHFFLFGTHPSLSSLISIFVSILKFFVLLFYFASFSKSSKFLLLFWFVYLLHIIIRGIFIKSGLTRSILGQFSPNLSF